MTNETVGEPLEPPRNPVRPMISLESVITPVMPSKQAVTTISDTPSSGGPTPSFTMVPSQNTLHNQHLTPTLSSMTPSFLHTFGGPNGFTQIPLPPIFQTTSVPQQITQATPLLTPQTVNGLPPPL
ncbi:unnamed protein product [Lactuca virosa]|uniref:Uncharacterized protein n=1 Tax=Lactuca virosa TaxID=75947 RepID=A0AAU9LRF3_9ASTR|nr:unnamed protein product [Lactuca virosa]